MHVCVYCPKGWKNNIWIFYEYFSKRFSDSIHLVFDWRNTVTVVTSWKGKIFYFFKYQSMLFCYGTKIGKGICDILLVLVLTTEILVWWQQQFEMSNNGLMNIVLFLSPAVSVSFSVRLSFCGTAKLSILWRTDWIFHIKPDWSQQVTS